MAFVAVPQHRYLGLGDAWMTRSKQTTMVGSGECSRQSPLWLVGEDVSEAKEEEVALLLRTSGEQHCGLHAQLLAVTLLAVAATAVGLALVGLQ